MTDDISKVVPPAHAPTFVPSFSEAARCLGVAQAAGNRSAIAHWHHIVNAHEVAAEAALRLESATTPAEVDSKVADHLALLEMMRGPDRSQWGITERMFATLARQLAEAKAENAIATSVHEHERLNLMSQLAEATRRLREVEGLVNDALALQQKHYGDGMDTHMALADWARNAKAAIDARLASDSEGGSDE